MGEYLIKEYVKKYIYIFTTEYACDEHFSVLLLDHRGLEENGLDPDGTKFTLCASRSKETEKKLCDLWVGEMVKGFSRGTYIMRIA